MIVLAIITVVSVYFAAETRARTTSAKG